MLAEVEDEKEKNRLMWFQKPKTQRRFYVGVMKRNNLILKLNQPGIAADHKQDRVC